MPLVRRLAGRTAAQVPPRSETAALRSSRPVLLGDIRPLLVRAIINPKRGMEAPQSHTPRPSGGCSSPGAAGRLCGNLDVRVVVLLVTLAGALILLLLYKLLQMRHRLRLAQARHALEYHSFYHTATYTLKHPTPLPEPPAKNGTLPEAVPGPTETPAATTTATLQPPPPAHPPPQLPLPPPPVLPPLPFHPPPSRPVTPPVPPVLPLPMIHTIPPSPHLSWGACSDADVYSRIGAFRPSRLSSLSSQSTVILFEHSSL